MARSRPGRDRNARGCRRRDGPDRVGRDRARSDAEVDARAHRRRRDRGHDPGAHRRHAEDVAPDDRRAREPGRLDARAVRRGGAHGSRHRASLSRVRDHRVDDLPRRARIDEEDPSHRGPRLMTTQRPLLMIPGPIEVAPAVGAAYSAPPAGHLAPDVIEAFGASLEMMRRVWLAPSTSQPFAFAGSGTTAMEMAVANLIEPGDSAVVVNTGYFSDRMAEMLRRAGSTVVELTAVPGEVPNASRAEGAIADLERAGKRAKALFATHVDTSTAALCDPKPLAEIARAHGALS